MWSSSVKKVNKLSYFGQNFGMITALSLNETDFFRLILDNVSDCLVVVDRTGEIVLINRPYCELLGGTPESYLGRHVNDVISPNSKLAYVAKGGERVVGESLLVRGQEMIVKQVPITLGGEIIGALGVALFNKRELSSTVFRRLTSNTLALPDYAVQWKTKYRLDSIVGTDSKIDQMKEQILQAAKTDYPLLIEGETGTGKELVAHATHSCSSRAAKPFVAINCATIPSDLIASELFGYEGGAFSGANSKGARGKLELAHGGTLFLDEIGDIPPSTQVALLRALQEKEIVRVGGSRPVSIDVRLISATNKNMQGLIAEGKFREDFLYRVKVHSIRTTPLRERTDIETLANTLLIQIAEELNKPNLRLNSRVKSDLEGYHWPGNVRQLQGVLQASAAVLPEGIQVITELVGVDRFASHDVGVRDINGAGNEYKLAEIEIQAISRAMRQSEGNLSKAASLLGISRSGMYKKLEKFRVQER